MDSLLGDNRYQMLFVDDDEADEEIMPDQKVDEIKEEAPKPKQQRNKKEKKVNIIGDKVKSLVINNNNYKNVGMPPPMLPSMQLQQKQHQQRDLQNNNSNNRDRVFPTRNFRQSRAYANNNRRSMPFKECDASNQQQQPQLAQDNSTNINDNSTEDDKLYITIEEYEAMRVERAKPVYNIRQAGEGEMVRPEWQSMTVLPKKKKNKTSQGNSGNGLAYDAAMYPQRWRRQQRIDVEFKFNDDRRRNNGNRGRNYNRNNNVSDAAHVGGHNPIDVQDIAAFPTLG